MKLFRCSCQFIPEVCHCIKLAESIEEVIVIAKACSATAGYCAGVEGREITFLAKGDRRFKVLLVPEYPVGEAEPDDQK